MGYVALMFTCVNCRQPATANPRLVLTIPVRWDADTRQHVPDPDGRAEPVCRACAERALERVRDSDPTLTSFPALLRDPDYLFKAYDEPADENEV